MIKFLLLFVLMLCPLLAFSQESALLRPNHTLSQYGSMISKNGNGSTPRGIIHSSAVSPIGGYADLYTITSISKDKSIPSIYADGSAGTLEQIGRMADGSVQQYDVGIRVTPLDKNEIMFAQVSGDSSAPPVITTNSTTARKLSDRAADYLNIKDFGALLGDTSGSTDIPIINKLFSSNISNAQSSNQSRIVEIPAGHWPNPETIPNNTADTDFVSVLGRLENYPVFSVSDHNIGIGVPYFGDCVLSETHNSMTGERLNFSRVDSRNTDKCKYKPSIGVTLVSDTPNQSGEDTNSGNKNITFTHITTPQYHGYGENLSVKGIHLSLAGMGAQDVDDYVRSIIYGNEWVWAHNTEYNHMIPFSNGHGPFSPEWVYDDSAAGVGRDTEASAYDPRASYRKFHWITLNTHVNNDNNTNKDLKWLPNKLYHTGRVIIVPSSGNSMFYNMSGEATTGSTEPTWPKAMGETVSDGGIRWKNMGKYTFDFGCIFCVAGASDTKHNVRIGTLMSEYDVKIYNALFDFSVASWEPSLTTHVFARLQPDTYLDLSANGTQASQNNHLLGYDSRQKTLTYKVNGIPVISVKDNGGVISSAPLQMPIMTRAHIRAYPDPVKGMEIYDSDDDAPAVYTARGWKLTALSSLPAN